MQVVKELRNLIACELRKTRLEDYFSDKEIDEINHKYNPINSGVWEYNKTRESIIKEIESIKIPVFDEVFPIELVKGREIWFD